MVRYCEKHRHAWPVSEKWDGKACPFGKRVAASMPPCPVRSVDAIVKINDLGFELEGRDEEEREGEVT